MLQKAGGSGRRHASPGITPPPRKRRRTAARSRSKASRCRIDSLPSPLRRLVATFLSVEDHQRLATCSKDFGLICKQPSSFCPVIRLARTEPTYELMLFLETFNDSRIELHASLELAVSMQHLSIRLTSVDTHGTSFNKREHLNQLAGWKPKFPVRQLDAGQCDDDFLIQCLETFPELETLIINSTLQVGHLILACPSLKTLVLHNPPPDLRPLASLPHLSDVRLHLRIATVDRLNRIPLGASDLPVTYLQVDARFVDKKAAGIFRHCTELVLNGADDPIPADLRSMFPALKRLNLTAHGDASPPSWLAALRDMSLEGLSIERDSLMAGSELRFVPKTLEALILSHIVLQSADDLAGLDRLERLRLNRCWVRCLSPLKALQHLRVMNTTFEVPFPSTLSTLEINVGIEPRALLPCSNLRGLTVYHHAFQASACGICTPTRTGGTVAELAQLPLTKLSLDCTISLTHATRLGKKLRLSEFNCNIRPPDLIPTHRGATLHCPYI